MSRDIISRRRQKSASAGLLRTLGRGLGLTGAGAYGVANLGHQLGAWNLRPGGAPGPGASAYDRYKHHSGEFARKATEHLNQVQSAFGGGPAERDKLPGLVNQMTSGNYGGQPGAAWRNWGITKAFLPWVGGQEGAMTAGQHQTEMDQARAAIQAEYAAAMGEDIHSHEQMQSLLSQARGGTSNLPPEIRARYETILGNMATADPRTSHSRKVQDIITRMRAIGLEPPAAAAGNAGAAGGGTGSGWGTYGHTASAAALKNRYPRQQGRPRVGEENVDIPTINPAYQYYLDQNFRR